MATLQSEATFATTFDGVSTLQCMGNTGLLPASYPNGVDGSMVIEDGWFKGTIRTTDPDTASGIRAEITLPADAIGDETWLTWEMMVKPEDWTENTGTILVGQMHPQDAIVGAVNFGIYCVNGKLQFRSATNPTASSFAETIKLIEPLEFHKVYRFVVHALWKTDTTGFIEAFCNGQQIEKRADIKTAYTSDAPYFKLGVYDAPHAEDFGTKTARFRNLRRYSGKAGYSEILGGAPMRRGTYLGIV